MRVLQINSVCGVGSTGRIATDIDKILKSEGHEGYIAYGRGTARECDTVIKIGSNMDNYIHVAKSRLLDRHGFGSGKATMDFINKIDELNPDIIHLHNIHGYYINIELLFAYLRKVNKPVIWTLHDCWAFTGHCSHFDYVGCEKWKTGCYNCPQKSQYPASALLDNSKKNFLNKKELFTGLKNMTIVTPSKWLANLVKESFLEEYPVKVINNGIDLDVFKPTNSNFREEFGLQNKFIILGVATNWGMRKGYKYFLDLSSRIPDDEVIVLVGLTEKQVNNLPSNIIGITRTDSTKELAEIYSLVDVFVNPTVEEVMGLVNVEALACGTPVITFNTGGSIETVDEDCGFIVGKGNLDELIERIKLVKDKGKLNYSNRCLERTRRLYSKHDRFGDYINLYNEVVD
ncbi:glycosyltransferase [Bacillus sp. V3B]|uniref:glycosyltransferase n=1 Tax=Bacillus sp. V3B TaxID=2804915 RepID=UPI00210DCCF5|nr:glycosyltransferase [Bacillus sp. V3B]MCQ6274674.1 glycosyltransferase [Bacillus sp. V3B]